MTPPAPVSTTASVRNCQMTSRRRAPIALRTPISRVRCVTDISMMFITPTPPTSKPIELTTAVSSATEPVICLNWSGDFLRRGHAEIFRRRIGHVARAAQDRADFVLGLRHSSRERHGADEMLVVGGMMFPVGVIRHEHLFFRGRILEELAFAMLEHADDAIGKSLDVNNFVQRIAVREKGFAQVVADDGDVRAVQILRFGENTGRCRSGCCKRPGSRCPSPNNPGR